MIKKILMYFGYVDVSQVDLLKEDNLKLRAEIQATRRLELPFVNVHAEEPEPLDTQKRKAYVAGVAQFHHDVMKKKIVRIISDVQSQLGRLDSTVNSKGQLMTQYSPKDFDLILKGTVNALWLIYDWGENMVNEQLGSEKELPRKELDELQEKIIET